MAGSGFCLAAELRFAHFEEPRAEIAKGSNRVALDLAEIGVVDIEGVRWLNAWQTVITSASIRIAASASTRSERHSCAPSVRNWKRIR